MPTEFMSQAYDMGIIVDHEAPFWERILCPPLNEKVVEYGKINNQLMMVPRHVIPSCAGFYRADLAA